MQPAQMYDSAATMFSPDGRIYQVEYAREAVKRGTTAVGIVYDEGALLLVDKRFGSPLIEPSSVEKLFKIDQHIGCASSGLVADARVLVARARVEAQQNRIMYGEPIELGILVKELSDLKQAYTQNGGVRPFGTALLLAGMDSERVRLFETDPSGAVVAYKASAIGVGRVSVMEFLEQEYRPGLTQEAAAKLGFTALKRVTEGGQAAAPDIAILDRKEGFRRLSAEEVKTWQERFAAS
ncbi:MAG: archaeal proteasome endopeptidase complex subunit alpha [Thermoplasmatota archaeon]